MPVYIYNSLTYKKEEFVPLNPPHVNIYTCGITAYDECHIGHARSLYIFDVIRRYLKYRGFDVRFIRNITDIDDKIINRANELKINWKELVDKYINRYYEDLASLGIEKADVEPRATENIEDMIAHIKGLIERGFAYEADGDVYFSVRKFPEYGKLSNQSIDQMEAGARIEPSESKQDHLDFALWKKSKENEPSWESPWGRGRPGWHIECSTMSTKYLNTETLDIHAGGRDLIFPHHENEIAQSKALTGKPFAKYWMHNGLLTINGQKMAKSLGNFISVKDALKDLPEDAAADILKDFFLRAHYSHPIDYSQEAIREAKAEIYRFLEALKGDFDLKVDLKKLPKEIKREVDNQRKIFENSMDDDFNMPRARADICGLVRYCNYLLYEYKQKQTSELKHVIKYTRNTIRELSSVLGLTLDDKKFDNKDPKWVGATFVTDISEKEIEAKKNERNQLRKQKNFKEADKIRKELEVQGIILEDTKEGTIWRRKL